MQEGKTSPKQFPRVAIVGIVLAMIGVAVFWWMQAKASKEKSLELFVEAARLYEKRNYQEAIAKASEAITYDSSNANAYFIRAASQWDDITTRRLSNIELYDQAESDFHRARALTSDAHIRDLCKRTLNLIRQWKAEHRVYDYN